MKVKLERFEDSNVLAGLYVSSDDGQTCFELSFDDEMATLYLTIEGKECEKPYRLKDREAYALIKALLNSLTIGEN